MTGDTTDNLLRRLATVCHASARVESYAVDACDEDTLSVRVFLGDGTFVNAFYNLVTGKVVFAWIRERTRLYGKDNAKMGWHAHPFGSPKSHEPCDAVDFKTFLGEVEIFHAQSQSGEKA